MKDDDKLPPGAHAKIFALKEAEQQALTSVNANQRQIGELQRLVGNAPEGDKAQAWRRDIHRLQELQGPRQSRHKALADLNARIEYFLHMLPARAELDDAKKIKTKLKPGETHLQAVERIRGDIARIIGERSRVERSSPTTKEMKAQAAAYVQALADRSTPRLIIEHGRFAIEFGRGVIGETEPRPLEVLSWIDPTIVLQRLEAQIDAMPKPANAMNAADRKQRLDEIKIELFETERLEAAHIDAALDEDTVIPHRPNIDCRALLGIVIRRDKAQAA